MGFEFDQVAGDHLPHGRLLQTSVDCSAVALLPWNCRGWELGVLRQLNFLTMRNLGKRSIVVDMWQDIPMTLNCKWIADLKIEETLTKSWRHENDL